jgi:hypothetical protein
MLIKNCRSCGSNKIKKLFSLGRLSFTGKFPKNKNENIPKAELRLIICKNCELVQLSKSFDLKYLYGLDYGYRTGINKTMTNHMKLIQKTTSQILKLKRNDAILDIASNDGTLLNFYKKNIFKVGVDPVINKFKKYYKNIDISIAGFFSKKNIEKKTKKKFKLITALSVFYDIEDPSSFLSDVKDLLHDDGILVLEHADLLSIIKYKMFDTICHEHLEYYSHKVIFNLLKINGLKVFDLKFNDINGGSTQYYICKKNCKKYKINSNKINNALKKEKNFKLGDELTYKNFFKDIKNIKLKLVKLLKNIKKKNKIIHGYGASTKGNVILQYFGIDKKYIDLIADRNPKKNGNYTPNTKIKIVKENISRKLNPDFYLVLPWHFKKEILIREKKQKKYTKFIFPLPKLKVY